MKDKFNSQSFMESVTKFFSGKPIMVMDRVSIDKVREKVWESTPNLQYTIETDGEGNFRHPFTKAKIKGWRRKGEGALIYSPRMGRYGHMVDYISLQKFVALIYHPNLNGAISTKVKDGNAFNLHKDNVAWNTSKSGSRY